MAICLLATQTAYSLGGIRKSTCSHGAILGVHVNASQPPHPTPLSSFSLSLSSLLQLAPTQGFGTALARSAWDENNKATKISCFTEQSFLLWQSVPLSLCYQGQSNNLWLLVSPPAKISALNLPITLDCLDNGVLSFCPSLPQEIPVHFPHELLSSSSTSRPIKKFDTITFSKCMMLMRKTTKDLAWPHCMLYSLLLLSL